MTDMRIPPHDDQAEEATLGGALTSMNVMGELTGILTEKDFYQPRHQLIWKAMTSLYTEGKPIDAVLVGEKLKQVGDLEKAGGANYLADLTQSIPTPANSLYYAHIVHDKALLRRVIDAGTRITQLGYSEGTPQDVINEAQAQAYALSDSQIRSDYQTIGQAAGATLNTLKAEHEGHGTPGLYTGFPDLDDTTHGFQPGQLIIIAGRPAMGKSTFAMDIARHAVFLNTPTILFSLEMSIPEMSKRILAAESGVRLDRLMDERNLSMGEWEQLNNTLQNIQDRPLFLDDSANMSMMEIRAKCRRLKQSQNLGLIIIDYLQLMSSLKPRENRNQEVSEFSRQLKLLAKELEVPVIALSQLNRGVEMRQDKRPMLSDLRESGSIEQDADMVFFVYRPEVYNPEERQGEADIILAKHRNGPLGKFPLAFRGDLCRFRPMPHYSSQNRYPNM